MQIYITHQPNGNALRIVDQWDCGAVATTMDISKCVGSALSNTIPTRSCAVASDFVQSKTPAMLDFLHLKRQIADMFYKWSNKYNEEQEHSNSGQLLQLQKNPAFQSNKIPFWAICPVCVCVCVCVYVSVLFFSGTSPDVKSFMWHARNYEDWSFPMHVNEVLANCIERRIQREVRNAAKTNACMWPIVAQKLIEIEWICFNGNNIHSAQMPKL